MKYNGIGIVFAICSAHLLQVVNGAGRVRVSNPPETCVAKKLGPDSAHNSLARGEAICNGDWMFGINSCGDFGLWKGNKKVQGFMRGAQGLLVHNKNDGNEALVSVYKYKLGLPQVPLWELECTGLSGEQQTTLKIVKGFKVVKFNQGLSPQNKLWSVKKNGDSRLDKTFCQITDRSDHMSNFLYGDLISLRENTNYCISYSKAFVGKPLKLVKCDKYDTKHIWDFARSGQWQAADDGCLCVDAGTPDGDGNRKLFLNLCGEQTIERWGFDWNGDEGITPDRGISCVSYDKSRNKYQNADIVLEKCGDRGQTWKFYDRRWYHSRDECVEKCYKDFLPLSFEWQTTDDLDGFYDKYGINWDDEKDAYEWVLDCKETECGIEWSFLKSRLEYECLWYADGFNFKCQRESGDNCEEEAINLMWTCLANRKVDEGQWF